MEKRELVALLYLSSWCLVMVERLFLGVPRGCLQFVIVVFPDHTHLLFLWSPAGNRLTSWLSFVVFNCIFVAFPCGILGQVWYYLIVSILDLCHLINFKAVWILIRWLRQKPADLGLHCFLKSIKRVQQDKDIPAILSYNTAFTELPTQRDSDVIFCLQLLIQSLTCTHHLR